MEEITEAISLDKKLVLTRTLQFCAFVVVAVVAPYFLNQLVTGSIINALFFISAELMGIEAAFLLCLIPSLFSLSVGLLPLSLAPMVPFVMTGNALLVLVFSKLKIKNFWLASISASVIKFLFIYGASILLFNFALKGNLPKTVLLMMSWPQLVTALSGAVIAYVFLRVIRKYN
jgi:hypothetical protein